MTKIKMLEDWKNRKTGDTWNASAATAEQLVTAGKAELATEDSASSVDQVSEESISEPNVSAVTISEVPPSLPSEGAAEAPSSDAVTPPTAPPMPSSDDSVDGATEPLETPARFNRRAGLYKSES